MQSYPTKGHADRCVKNIWL